MIIEQNKKLFPNKINFDKNGIIIKYIFYF